MPQALEGVKGLRLFIRLVTFRSSLLALEGCDAERLEHKLDLLRSCKCLSTCGRRMAMNKANNL